MLIREENLVTLLSQGFVSRNATIRKDGLLLTLGNMIQTIKPRDEHIIDPSQVSELDYLYDDFRKDWAQTVLGPEQFILFSTAEEFDIPQSCYGIITTLTHVARLGIMIHACSNYVDRAFQGFLTLEVKNLTQHSFLLKQGMPLGKLILFESPEAKMYDHFSSSTEKKLIRSNNLSSNYPQLFSDL